MIDRLLLPIDTRLSIEEVAIMLTMHPEDAAKRLGPGHLHNEFGQELWRLDHVLSTYEEVQAERYLSKLAKEEEQLCIEAEIRKQVRENRARRAR